MLASIVAAIVCGVIGVGAGVYLPQEHCRRQDRAGRSRSAADYFHQQNAEARKKELVLEGKEEVHKLRTDAERENKERRSELQRMERRLLQKEEHLDKKFESIEKKRGIVAA